MPTTRETRWSTARLPVRGAGPPSAARERTVHEQRRDRKDQPEAGLPAVLLLRRLRQVDVDRVGAGAADEVREQVRRERDVGAEMRRVADISGDEVVAEERRPAVYERREPAEDRNEQHADAHVEP